MRKNKVFLFTLIFGRNLFLNMGSEFFLLLLFWGLHELWTILGFDNFVVAVKFTVRGPSAFCVDKDLFKL